MLKRFCKLTVLSGILLPLVFTSCWGKKSKGEVRYFNFKPESAGVYEQAFSAGKGQELPDTAEILECVAIPKTLMRFKDNICVAYVRGDSMEPTLFDDDIIIFDNFGYDGTDGHKNL